MNSKTGTLHIVATPIGNLGDISRRAIQTLSEVDVVLAEDTRHTAKLLSHFGISAQLRSYHEHNERELYGRVIEQLKNGESIALVSDAGTPLISDPGYRLVRAAREEGLSVTAVPGPCALVAALGISGLPTDRFCFEGFLPSRSAARKDRLRVLCSEARTLVFYESSHRILASMQDIAEVMNPGSRIFVARELTKSFESAYTGTAAEVAAALEADHHQRKGEFVMVISNVVDDSANRERALKLAGVLAGELPKKSAARIAADTFDVSKNDLYARLLESEDK